MFVLQACNGCIRAERQPTHFLVACVYVPALNMCLLEAWPAAPAAAAAELVHRYQAPNPATGGWSKMRKAAAGMGMRPSSGLAPMYSTSGPWAVLCVGADIAAVK